MIKSGLAVASASSLSIFGHSPSGSMDLYESSFLQQSLTHIPMVVILPLHESQAVRPARPSW